jgi:3',5'-cyclic-nucleotide phosphodiesterase
MDLRVLGCHGGESPRHRTTAFLLDERMALDAGALTTQLELVDQTRLEGVLVSHSHMDHVRDLAAIADNRCQLECAPLTIAATRPTIDALKAHFFNEELWPDFTVIPSPDQPTIVYQEIPLEIPTNVLGYTVRAIAVNHTVDAAGFVVADRAGAIAFSGDTGPTDRFWQVLAETKDLKALLMEVSFPNAQQALASASGHHTPQTLLQDLKKLAAPQDLATMLYHIKPPFQAEVEKECAKLLGLNLHVLCLDDHFIF